MGLSWPLVTAKRVEVEDAQEREPALLRKPRFLHREGYVLACARPVAKDRLGLSSNRL